MITNTNRDAIDCAEDIFVSRVVTEVANRHGRCIHFSLYLIEYPLDGEAFIPCNTGHDLEHFFALSDLKQLLCGLDRGANDRKEPFPAGLIQATVVDARGQTFILYQDAGYRLGFSGDLGADSMKNGLPVLGQRMPEVKTGAADLKAVVPREDYIQPYPRSEIRQPAPAHYGKCDIRARCQFLEGRPCVLGHRRIRGVRNDGSESPIEIQTQQQVARRAELNAHFRHMFEERSSQNDAATPSASQRAASSDSAGSEASIFSSVRRILPAQR